ncbi:MAG: hypothetical protein D6782_02265 [Alphaproteobacteria bacterium]|nr:MAG: hypothetical protein D6782_02265 [Alphaproteobacteria bacterium]
MAAISPKTRHGRSGGQRRGALLALLLWAGSAAEARAELLRLEVEFAAESLVGLGAGSVPQGPVNGSFVLIVPAPQRVHGLLIEERVAIALMHLKIGETYFLPRQTRAVLTALDGTPIRLVIGGLPDGPYALDPRHNDFKLVFTRVPDLESGDVLVFEEFSVTLADQGGTGFTAIAGSGTAKAQPLRN